MVQASFIKKLFRSNLGESGMHDRYITVPAKTEPVLFFGDPPKIINCIDKTTGDQYQFPLSLAANGEYRLTQFSGYFENKNANVGDEVVIDKVIVKNSIEYRIDLIKKESIFVESNSLRQFALKVFVFCMKEFGEDFLNTNLTSDNYGDINGRKYKAIRFPKYFGKTNMLAKFAEEQDKKSLTTGKSQRYSDENLKILDSDYIYFNFQWSQPENSASADFYELKKFVEDWTGSKYDLIFLEVEGKINYRQVLNHRIEIQFDLYLSSFQKACESAGLIFKDTLIKRFISSLSSKPFVILTGLSGSGKTKLTQAFALWICENKNQYAIVPVGADWTNREPMVGYPNSLIGNHYVMPDTGVLDLMLSAHENYLANDKDLSRCKPFFLILDEMNMSHVERYFADFLSAMESGDEIKLYRGSKRFSELDAYGNGILNSEIPENITLPKNLFIVGTVNIDESTYMFSPKVLDRANTIEFRVSKEDMELFYQNSKPLNLDALSAGGKDNALSFMSLTEGNHIIVDRGKHSKIFVAFFEILQLLGAEFGYRTANEMAILVSYLSHFGLTDIEAYDVAIMQKLLPKLHGSRSKLNRVLPKLCELFKDKYPISLEKLERMKNNAEENGFASYAEA